MFMGVESETNRGHRSFASTGLGQENQTLLDYKRIGPKHRVLKFTMSVASQN